MENVTAEKLAPAHRCFARLELSFASPRDANRSYPGRRAGPPTGRMRVVDVRQRGATKGEQVQGFGPKYHDEWGEALKHKEMPKRDCGHSSWVRYPSGGLDQARMVPLHGGIPDPRETGSRPGLISPNDDRPRCEGWKWGARIQAPLAREGRTQGESKQRTAVSPVSMRVRGPGATGEAQSRTSGEDWQPARGSAAKPGSRGSAAFGWGGTCAACA
jgi:hypothetical protein